MDIKTTKNYKLFKRIKGNRPLDINHTKSLVLSVSQKNLLEHVPLIVNEKMEVIDGQHRLEASKMMELPVHYIVVKGGSIEDIRRLNSYSRPWTMLDYLESYIELGLQDYAKLKAFASKYGFSPSISLLILSNVGANEKAHLHQSALDIFKKGEFSIYDLEASQELASKLQELKPYLELGVWGDRDFIEALMVAYKTISQMTLLEKLREYPSKIQKRARYKDYLRQLEDVVSKGSRHNIRLG